MINLSKYTKIATDGLEKLGLSGSKFSGAKFSGGAENLLESLKPSKDVMASASSMMKVLAGTSSMLGEYYFPPELIGGTCPRVVGEEEEIVWNAAAEACDSERVHVVWQSVENRIWYLAARSSELASHPNTWCPFASLLPGMKDATPAPVCYTYYGEDTATMMTVTTDTLQIYRGTALVVRAKAERAARELGDAAVIELVPDKVMELIPLPWYSLSLFEDRARRILAGFAVASALGLTAFAFLVWLFASLSLIASKHDLTEALDHTEKKTIDLMQKVQVMRTSPMRDRLAEFSDLNDSLLSVNGFLEIYEIKESKVRWRAVVPTNVTADRINEMGGKNIQTTPEGVAIGNQGQIEFEAQAAGRK